MSRCDKTCCSIWNTFHNFSRKYWTHFLIFMKEKVESDTLLRELLQLAICFQKVPRPIQATSMIYDCTTASSSTICSPDCSAASSTCTATSSTFKVFCSLKYAMRIFQVEFSSPPRWAHSLELLRTTIYATNDYIIILLRVTVIYLRDSCTLNSSRMFFVRPFPPKNLRRTSTIFGGYNSSNISQA